MLFLTAAGGHRFGLIETVPFFWLLGVTATFALIGLALSASGFSSLWKYGDRGGKDSVRGAIVALIVLCPFLVSGYRVVAYPRLNDISTDVVDPPRLAQAQRLRSGAMNAIDAITAEEAELQTMAYPAVTGRRYDVPFDRVLESVETVLATRNWVRLGQSQSGPPDERETSGLTLEVTAWSFWLGFPVDVAIRIVDEGETSFVDMRSSSRYMQHDMGDNARRVMAFLDELGQDVAGKVAVAPAAGD
ncbi:MAG: DUF1499 domain-containing protein [Rhizobiaceae bacterium]